MKDVTQVKDGVASCGFHQGVVRRDDEKESGSGDYEEIANGLKDGLHVWCSSKRNRE